MGFPENLAQKSNMVNEKGEKNRRPLIVFRNYHKFVSKDTLGVLNDDDEAENN